MENQDRELILGLANRLRQAQPVQKDPQAAELIARHVGSQPDAVYLLVQAVLVQEDALRTAQARIAELQAAQAAPPVVAAAQGGFMSRVFGQNRNQAVPAAAPMVAAPAAGSGGGSFLNSAAATAVGVAGGALLFQGLSNAFGGHGGDHYHYGDTYYGDPDPGGWDDPGGWADGDLW